MLDLLTLKSSEIIMSHFSWLNIIVNISRLSRRCPPSDCTDELYNKYSVYQCLPTIPHDTLRNFKSSMNNDEEEEGPKI